MPDQPASNFPPFQVTRVQPGQAKTLLQHPALEAVSGDKLRATVETLAYPRSYSEQRPANETARNWLTRRLQELGYRVIWQGTYDNVIACPPTPNTQPLRLLGAHYDSVPETPGADDNNSAIALCLEAARVLALHQVPVAIAFFNGEEEGLLGSRDFVEHFATEVPFAISEAHIFEMVGYFSTEPGSQSIPPELPIDLPQVGDFIGVLSNQDSHAMATAVEHSAHQIHSTTPLVTLKIFGGLEQHFRDLLRSDHRPFWDAHLPALMWTDTANFRNPHYHSATDTPDTLNYHSLADVTRLLIGHLLLSTGVTS